MMKIMQQSGIFPWGPGHYLLISLDAAPWAHDLLGDIALQKDPNYQIVEGESTFVGYEFGSEQGMFHAYNLLRAAEQERFTNNALEAKCFSSESS